MACQSPGMTTVSRHVSQARGVAPSFFATAFQAGPCRAFGPASAWAISCCSVSMAEADAIIACVNRVGEVQRIPEDPVEMTTSKDHP